MSENSKKLLVVDTNIISHALIPRQTEAYRKLFEQLESEYRFVVSGFSKFEILRTSDSEHRSIIKTFIQNDLVLVDLSNTLMDFASRMHYLYSKHVSTKSQKISEGDVINAALAVCKNCPVLTIDNLDYPTPFFQEIRRERVSYNSSRNREIMDTVYLVQPDMENIKYCFQEFVI